MVFSYDRGMDRRLNIINTFNRRVQFVLSQFLKRNAQNDYRKFSIRIQEYLHWKDIHPKLKVVVSYRVHLFPNSITKNHWISIKLLLDKHKTTYVDMYVRKYVLTSVLCVMDYHECSLNILQLPFLKIIMIIIRLNLIIVLLHPFFFFLLRLFGWCETFYLHYQLLLLLLQ